MEDKDRGQSAEVGKGSCVGRLLQSRCLVVVEMASLGMVSVTFRG